MGAPIVVIRDLRCGLLALIPRQPLGYFFRGQVFQRHKAGGATAHENRASAVWQDTLEVGVGVFENVVELGGCWLTHRHGKCFSMSSISIDAVSDSEMPADISSQ